jgi:hypothetical protein
MGLNQIQTGRFNRLVQKLFSMKGSAQLTEVGAEILPIIPIRVGVEVRVFESWERFAAAASQAAVGAQVTNFRLRNPKGSNVVAVLEKLYIASSIADGFVRIANGITADLGTSKANLPLDNRIKRAAATLIATTTNNNAAPGSVIGALSVAAGIGQDFILNEDQEITLLPGDGIDVTTTAVNTQLLVVPLWRERALEESELL